MARLSVLLLACLAIAACRSAGSGSNPRAYPVTMLPSLVDVTDVPGAFPGARTLHVGLWDRDGNELISGMYDVGAQHFVEGTVFLLGKLPEEFVLRDIGNFEDAVGRKECSFLMRCSDPGVRGEFLRAQSPLDHGQALGQEQALVAFGGLVALLSNRGVAEPRAAAGADPCARPIRQDYCTWSPELFPVACCRHDGCYGTCSTSGASQSECDAQFLTDMRSEASFWTLPFVPVYYSAVRSFGKALFLCN